jgi:glycolate oxidase FAD binding subunit
MATEELHRQLRPTTFEQAAAELAQATAQGQTVRIRGGGSKSAWGRLTSDPPIELATAALDRILEHNPGDFTAIVQAGTPLARVQDELAGEGQMLALDPPLGTNGRKATIGGVFATGDSGPLRHRYGAPRDLVLGVTVALADGTIAKAGSKVIKNVAGYDLGKLFTGAFGTLGLILSVCVRLHPLPVHTASALGATADPDVLDAAARTLSKAPLELESLDVAWRGGRGGILARCAGAEAVRRARRVATMLGDAGLTGIDVADDDTDLWARQRAGQRSVDGVLVRVASRPSALAAVLRSADAAGGTLVGRATLGTSYIAVEPAATRGLLEALPARATAMLLDAPEELRGEIDPWGATTAASLELMRRVKARFDPTGVCNPGIFVT